MLIVTLYNTTFILPQENIAGDNTLDIFLIFQASFSARVVCPGYCMKHTTGTVQTPSTYAKPARQEGWIGASGTMRNCIMATLALSGASQKVRIDVFSLFPLFAR